MKTDDFTINDQGWKLGNSHTREFPDRVDGCNERARTRACSGLPVLTETDLKAFWDAPGDDDEPKTPQRQYNQVMRLLTICSMLGPLLRGATLDEIRDEVSDEVGTYCERTIRRDLDVLMAYAMVERVGEKGMRTRYRWASKTVRGAIYRCLGDNSHQLTH